MRDGSCDCLSVAGPHQKRNINKNFILDFNFGHHYDDDDGDDDKDDGDEDGKKVDDREEMFGNCHQYGVLGTDGKMTLGHLSNI